MTDNEGAARAIDAENATIVGPEGSSALMGTAVATNVEVGAISMDLFGKELSAVHNYST